MKDYDFWGDQYVAKKGDLAGFDLIGRRQDDGSIRLGARGEGEALPDWPEEVELLGNVYTLEEVKKQNGPQVPIGNRDIEWGIYV